MVTDEPKALDAAPNDGASLGNLVSGRAPASDAASPLDTGLLGVQFGVLLVPGGAACAAELETLSARAAVYATSARGEGTLRAYRSAWHGYEA